MAIDEKQLVAELQDPKTASKAFDLLMREYGEKVYWQIRKMVQSHDDANDLLQNCFIKVWNNLHNFRGDAKLSTWLYKIAVNESINYLNKERQRRGLTEEKAAVIFSRRGGSWPSVLLPMCRGFLTSRHISSRRNSAY